MERSREKIAHSLLQVDFSKLSRLQLFLFFFLSRDYTEDLAASILELQGSGFRSESAGNIAEAASYSEINGRITGGES